ncbi:hypothetical protein BJX61DRAFT_382266 [Aspergillus egyptiacus]|nr:hypothetical protein BJX61DRAFT_382266 [Aspergillus egyptiacus]
MPLIKWHAAAYAGFVPTLTTTSKTTRKEALKIATNLIRFITNAGCTMSTVIIGFWTPSRSWWLYVKVLEEADSNPRAQAQAESEGQWLPVVEQEILSYLSPGEAVRLPIPEPAESLRESLDYQDGKWKHYSRFEVYRGIPFPVDRDGVSSTVEWYAYMCAVVDDMRDEGLELDLGPASPTSREVLRRSIGDLDGILARFAGLDDDGDGNADAAQWSMHREVVRRVMNKGELFRALLRMAAYCRRFRC